MKVIEYGQSNDNVIMFLHGGGLSWWNFREEAELLKEKYHIIIPILNGHADSDNHFTTIEKNAKDITEYINNHLQGKVYAICGLSLGAQILIEMLSQNNTICNYAVIESALVIPMRITHHFIDFTIDKTYSFIEKRWFAKLQFHSLNMKKEYFENYYSDSCKITKENMIAFLKANTSYSIKESLQKTNAKVLILVGSKEQKRMKDSAKIIEKSISDSKLEILTGYTHGEISLNHAHEYVRKLEQLFMEKV